ncbi:MAG: aminotransferase class I/II-fold pyridoxal phosphate-dependent enzyme [Chloroflexi bacterium]|nr:aminotransferase class I/II-fold pyridoxal phosphate-dependent enzyme [Chloroflexota bacterium]
MNEWSKETIAARGGHPLPAAANQPAVEPIYQTAVYTFTDLEQVDEILEGRQPGYFYARFGLPNLATFEETVADLEGGSAGLVAASGMAAITLALLSHLSAGDHIVAAEELYGGTLGLLRSALPRFGIRTTFVDATNPAAVERAITPETRAVLVEIISNPTLKLVDLPALADLAHGRNALLLVDNTLATPVLCRPLEFGADVVIHSATKYLAGHDDVTAGILVGPADFIQQARELGILMGTTLGAFDAWLALRGVRTLALRMERICRNSQALAERLSARREVRRVYYPGLPAHPQHDLARELLPRGAGGIVSFEVAGGLEAASTVLRRLGQQGIPFAPSLGGVTTTTTHPGKTSHRGLAPEERARLGISDGLIRLSVGIEDPADLVAALDRALEGLTP